MIDLTVNKKFKYILFADLYFPEGLIDVISPILIPIYLINKGLPVEIVTIVVGIAGIPWVIKFLWSGFIDKYSKQGHKKFIFIGSLVAVFCFFILAFIDPSQSIITFVIVFFISQIGQSFHDSTADAWAIDISEEKIRGKINASMNAGHNFGIGFCAVTLSIIAESFGYNYMFIFAGLYILIILIFPLLIKDTIQNKKQDKVTPILINEFKINKIKLVIIFAIIIGISSGLLAFVIPLFATNILELSVSQIGLIAGFVPIITIVGSIIGGLISDRWGRKIAIYTMILPSIILICTIMFTRSLLFLIIPYFIVILLSAGRWAASSAMFMDVTNKKIRATEYSMFNSLEILGYVISSIFTGLLIGILGYNYIFIFISLTMIPPLIILYFIKLNRLKHPSK